MAETATTETRGRKKKLFIETGHGGLKQFSGHIREEFATPLMGTNAVRTYREMGDNDSIIGGTIFAFERVMLQASWEVIPADQSDIQRTASQFIHECLRDTSHTFNDFMVQVLTMLRFGWSWFEIVYKIRNGRQKDGTSSNYNDGRIGWRKFGLRSQESLLRWEIDPEDGSIRGMWQNPPVSFIGAASTEPRMIPIEKSVLFRTKIEKNNPEGKSLLRHAWRDWIFKKVLEEIEAIGVERDLVGLPILVPPEDFDPEDAENADIVAWAKDLVSRLRRDEQEGVILPGGWELKLLGSPGMRQFNVNEIISRHDKRMTMAMMTQFMMLGMDGSQGSFAQVKADLDLFYLATIGWMESIGSTFSEFVIKPLLRLNPEFADFEEFPTIRPKKVVPQDLKVLGDFLSKLGRAGMIIPTERLQEQIMDTARMSAAPRASDLTVADVSDDKPLIFPSGVGPRKVTSIGPEDGSENSEEIEESEQQEE